MKPPRRRFTKHHGILIAALVAGSLLRLTFSSTGTPSDDVSAAGDTPQSQDRHASSRYVPSYQAKQKNAAIAHPTAQDDTPRAELPAAYQKQFRIDLFSMEMIINREALYQLGFSENEVTDIESLSQDIISEAHEIDLQRIQILENTPERTLIHLKSDPEAAARTQERVSRISPPWHDPNPLHLLRVCGVWEKPLFSCSPASPEFFPRLPGAGARSFI